MDEFGIIPSSNLAMSGNSKVTTECQEAKKVSQN